MSQKIKVSVSKLKEAIKKRVDELEADFKKETQKYEAEVKKAKVDFLEKEMKMLNQLSKAKDTEEIAAILSNNRTSYYFSKPRDSNALAIVKKQLRSLEFVTEETIALSSSDDFFSYL